MEINICLKNPDMISDEQVNIKIELPFIPQVGTHIWLTPEQDEELLAQIKKNKLTDTYFPKAPSQSIYEFIIISNVLIKMKDKSIWVELSN